MNEAPITLWSEARSRDSAQLAVRARMRIEVCTENVGLLSTVREMHVSCVNDEARGGVCALCAVLKGNTECSVLPSALAAGMRIL